MMKRSGSPAPFRAFLGELRRRKVWQVTVTYLTAGVAVALACAELYDDVGLPSWDPQTSYFMADIHALAGRPEPALRWLNNAVQRGFCNHPFMVTHDPLLEGIRDEPEFERISDRVKEEWLSFDA